MLCQVCGNPCRGKCAKCGAALCVSHRPSSTRAKCGICKTQITQNNVPGQVVSTDYNPGVKNSNAAISRHNGRQSAYTSIAIVQRPIRPPCPPLPDLAGMDVHDTVQYLSQLRGQIVDMQQNQLHYLTGRHARGAYTPTDISYGEYQVLEDKLLHLLDYIIEQAKQEGNV